MLTEWAGLQWLACNPPLAGQRPAQPAVVGQGDGEQLVIAVQQVGDRALGEGQRAAAQAAVDLGDGAVLGVAQGADQGNDVQAELVARQGEAPLGLGAVWAAVS